MLTETRKRCNVHIRWMIRRDMPDVLEIERDSFGDDAWQEETFVDHLRERNVIGMVAERDEQIVGYMLYELHRDRLTLLNFAVHPDFRRMGVGTQMIDKLIGKLTTQRRRRIVLSVRETNLPAQLFFRDMRFRAIEVVRGVYEDIDEAAYLMQYALEYLTV